MGVFGTASGFIVSLSAVEQWLRITSLVVGITVGVLSGISILRPEWLVSLRNFLWKKKR